MNSCRRRFFHGREESKGSDPFFLAPGELWIHSWVRIGDILHFRQVEAAVGRYGKRWPVVTTASEACSAFPRSRLPTRCPSIRGFPPASSYENQPRYRVRAQSTSSWRRVSRAEAGTLVTAIVSPSALKTSIEYPSVPSGAT